YQQQEQDSRLTVYGFANGKLTQKGPSISTLPAGFEGSNTTSELLIDKAGKTLYGANRNHDTIATMAAQGHGTLQLGAHTQSEGTIPSSIRLDPPGKFRYHMNQSADNLTIYKLDANGVPKFTGKFLGIGSPAVMVFLP